jgi:hypothetical protein
VRRRTIGAVALLVVVVAAYWFEVRDRTVSGEVIVPRATATIGSGADAVAVGPDGQLLGWFPVSADAQLPILPLAEAPKSGRLAGSVLQQAKVLGAAPAGLRPYLDSSYYGESGVDVRLRSGIELRFGDASQVKAKWRAAAAILADPSVTTLDYVNVIAPGRPAVGGSGHTLPPAE